MKNLIIIAFLLVISLADLDQDIASPVVHHPWYREWSTRQSIQAISKLLNKIDPSIMYSSSQIMISRMPQLLSGSMEVQAVQAWPACFNKLVLVWLVIVMSRDNFWNKTHTHGVNQLIFCSYSLQQLLDFRPIAISHFIILMNKPQMMHSRLSKTSF